MILVCMCDTIVALGNVTETGYTIFGKNSDRDPNEVHNILHVPRKKHEQPLVKTTYIEIPQVKETFEVLLLKPFWIWGAEMGANEFGVVIGNEAVWTKEKLEKKSLIGMDLLRLGLERGKTAYEAMKVITSLLEEYGQGGECGYDHSAKYHNSFIIADPREAWVLETAGRFWIAEKVKSIRAISNILTIGSSYDEIHPDLIKYAVEKGYSKNKDSFNFAKDFSSKFLPWAAKGKQRKECTTLQLQKDTGKISVSSFIKALRSHNVKTETKFNPRKSSMASPCLHASSFLTPSQTTGSHVADLRPNLQIHWVTGTSAPCTSLYKPLVLKQGIYDFYQGGKTFDEKSMWWKHELLHRLILKAYQPLINVYKTERDQLENTWIKQVETLINDPTTHPTHIFETTKQFLETALKKEDEWLQKVKQKVKSSNLSPRVSLLQIRYNLYWKKWDKKAKLPSLG